MTTKTKSKTVKPPVAVAKALKQFNEKLSQGMALIIQACEFYVLVIDNHSKWVDWFRSQRRDLPGGVWTQFERVGRHLLHPDLLPWFGNTGVRYLEKLSLSLQKKYAVEEIPVVGSMGKTVHIKVYDLTNELCKQVFDGSSIRSLKAQEAYIEAEELRKKTNIKIRNMLNREAKNDWEIISVRNEKILHVNNESSYDIEKLQKILKQLKKK